MLEIRRQINKAPNQSISNALLNLANNYIFKGELEKAEPLVLQSLEIRQQINSPLLRFAYNSLGILRHRQGRFAEAEECFQKAVSPNEDYHARVTNHYAEFLIDKGDLGKAENLLRENIAREVKQNGRNHPFYAECLTLLGKCLLKQNRADDA